LLLFTYSFSFGRSLLVFVVDFFKLGLVVFDSDILKLGDAVFESAFLLLNYDLLTFELKNDIDCPPSVSAFFLC